jgi:GTP-dependent phosphoenolpyruvate carboxykinase
MSSNYRPTEGSDRSDRNDSAESSGATSRQEDRTSVVDREKEEHGGVKIGSAFFGWLTATGMAILLTALVAAAGTAVGLATNTKAGAATSSATGQTG